MKKEKSCGAVIYYNRPDLIFLVIKSKDYQFYGFPKGHMEKNETEKDTAIREVLEETGLEIEIIDGFKANIFYKPFGYMEKEVVYFLGKSQNNCVTLQKEEVSDFKWLNYDEALTLITYENERNILKKAYQYLEKNT